MSPINFDERPRGVSCWDRIHKRAIRYLEFAENAFEVVTRPGVDPRFPNVILPKGLRHLS